MGANERMASPSSTETADVAVGVGVNMVAGDFLCISCLRASSASTAALSKPYKSRSKYIKVIGTIVRRRSMGKYLAFAEIQSTSSCTCTNSNSATEDDPFPPASDSDSDSDISGMIHADVVKVAFRRKSPSWNMAGNDTFPIKNSMLPYGAKVELYIVNNVDVNINAAAVKATTDPSTTDASSASSNNINGQDVDRQESTPLSHSQPLPSLSSSSVFEVHSWAILVNPSETALYQASLSATDDDRGNNEGISCSKYLRARQESFVQAQIKTRQQLTPPTASLPSLPDQSNLRKAKTSPSKVRVVLERDQKEQTQMQQDQPSELSTPPLLGHGDKKAKALRAKVFASWLIKNFSRDVLLVDPVCATACVAQTAMDHGSSSSNGTGSGSGVLDIAGGKGQLSIELSIQAGGVFCTVIDPLVRKRGMTSSSSISNGNGNGRGRVVGLSPRDKKRLDKIGAAQPLHIARPFGDGLLKIPEYDTLVKQASCLVGLHPDECTEAILDKALLYDKPVAIVPCCVFPHMFPDRYLAGRPDVPVTTYDDFLQYLLEKDDRLQKATLPFEGRNQVIYYSTYKPEGAGA
jgi:hypothetical protein